MMKQHRHQVSSSRLQSPDHHKNKWWTSKYANYQDQDSKQRGETDHVKTITTTQIRRSGYKGRQGPGYADTRIHRPHCRETKTRGPYTTKQSNKGENMERHRCGDYDTKRRTGCKKQRMHTKSKTRHTTKEKKSSLSVCLSVCLSISLPLSFAHTYIHTYTHTHTNVPVTDPAAM